jgi:hypothetical protein
VAEELVGYISSIAISSRLGCICCFFFFGFQSTLDKGCACIYCSWLKPTDNKAEKRRCAPHFNRTSKSLESAIAQTIEEWG